MENLDDFMKKKMLGSAPDDDQRFEFKEEYWQQAEALIVADERRKRRRRFFWWLYSSILVLGMAVGGYLWQQSNKAGNTGLASLDISEKTTAQDFSGSKNEAATTATASGDTIRGSQNSSSGQAATGSANPSVPIEPASTNPQTTPPASSIPSTQQSTQTLAAHQTSSTKTIRNKNAPKTGAIPSEGKSPKSVQKNAAVNSPALPANNDRNDPNAPGSQPTSATEAATPLPASGNPEAPVPQTKQTEPSFLPTYLRPLAPLTPRLPRMPQPDSTAAIAEKPPVAHRFGLTLNTFGSAYFPTDKSQAFGYGAGLTAEWRFGSSWALLVAPSWRARNIRTVLDSWEPASAQQLRYSFGFERDEYTLDGLASHWLEIPVGIQWRRGPWKAEAGVAPGFLLGVQGRMTHTHESSLESRSIDRKMVRLDKSAFYKNYIPVFAGGNYSLTRRLGVGVRMYYLGGDFRRPTDVDSSPRQTLWVDAGLRWNLF